MMVALLSEDDGRGAVRIGISMTRNLTTLLKEINGRQVIRFSYICKPVTRSPTRYLYASRHLLHRQGSEKLRELFFTFEDTLNDCLLVHVSLGEWDLLMMFFRFQLRQFTYCCVFVSHESCVCLCRTLFDSNQSLAKSY
jgi:hypothetical protein